MIHQKMLSTHLFLVQAITISIFLVLFIFPTSKCSGDDCYKECSSLVSCGNNHNIGYPFWGDNFRPPYCGHPAFKLDCPPSTPYTNLSVLYIRGNLNSSYPVLGINNSTMTITLQGFDSISGDQCLFPRSKLTDAIPADLIQYSSRVDNISLSYDCDPNKIQVLGSVKSFSCSHDEDYSDTTYYWKNHDTKGELKRICSSSIQVPVLHKANLNRGNVTLQSLLEMGFEVNYTNMFVKHCLPCITSGGACGFSSVSGFTCFCKRSTSHSDCRKPGGPEHPPALPPKPNAGNKNRKLKHILKRVIPIGACLFILAPLLIVVILYLKKHKFCSETSLSKRTSNDRTRSDLEFGNGIYFFSYTELQEATSNFDPTRVLGDGGFGVVYHGKLRDGREVAVKRLSERSYKHAAQFRNEVQILTTLNHPNLVTLYGCSSRHSRELLLVYEYIPNGTVADHLYGDRSQPGSLTWTLRMKIAIQTAEALSYLHATDIIHRDVKTNNILLDNYFTVKVADFGLSRLFPVDATHVSTAPQGTPGYLDPQYYKSYKVTTKSDVYSLGVVLIELISSLPAVDMSRDREEINLSTYAVNKIQHGKLAELVDHRVGFHSDFKVRRMVTLVSELAFQCLQQEHEVRPSMEEVLEVLKNIEGEDYEALEEEETTRGIEISNLASEVAENQVELPSTDTKNPSLSPQSVTASWASGSTAASDQSA